MKGVNNKMGWPVISDRFDEWRGFFFFLGNEGKWNEDLVEVEEGNDRQ